MNDSDERFVPSAWIPWVLAVAALFGWGALAPDHLSIGKCKRQEGIGQVQLADDLPAPGATHHPLAGLAPEASGSGWPFCGPSKWLSIEVGREVAAAEERRGGIQGRAPPAQA